MELLNGIDWQNASFMLLATIGFVNAVTFWKPGMDSKAKIIASVVFAFAISFIPAEFGNFVADKLKVAIGIALAASGSYKLVTKAGGK